MSTNDHTYAIVMAGGAGSRLWPMSRKHLPKQFQPLLGKETPFQLMIRLVSQVIPTERIMVMAPNEFKHLILEQAPQLGEQNILQEPERRDTGPAIVLGMLEMVERDPEATVLTVWSDHLILDEAKFAQVIEAGLVTVADHPNWLVNVGAKPTKADTSLGYIQMGSALTEHNEIEVRRVKRFVEKPDEATATRFFQSHEYLWNLGYNIMRAQSFIEQFKAVNPDLVDEMEHLAVAIREPYDAAAVAEGFARLPKAAIDYLFVEKIEHIAVVPADMGWSDIGTWAALHKMMIAKSGHSMVTKGEVHSIDTKNSLIFAKDRPVTLVGVQDLIVVDTGDAVLIMHNDAKASDLKKLVQETLSETNPELL